MPGPEKLGYLYSWQRRWACPLSRRGPGQRGDVPEHEVLGLRPRDSPRQGQVRHRHRARQGNRSSASSTAVLVTLRRRAGRPARRGTARSCARCARCASQSSSAGASLRRSWPEPDATRAGHRTAALAQVRKQLSLAQPEIAAAIGASIARFSQIGHGEVTSCEIIARYVEALGANASARATRCRQAHDRTGRR